MSARTVGTWVGRLLLMLAMVGCGLISAGFVAITVLYAMGDLDDPGDTVPGLPPTPVMTVPLAIACGAFAYGCWVAFADTFRQGDGPEGLAPPL